MQNKNYSKIKRILDILLSIILLILLSPCLIIISIKIKLDNDGPILFKQERLGKNGKTITIYKFRTMVPDADKKLFELLERDEEAREEYRINKKLKDDPRITKIGKILRKTSLDEFPQFINVLKGEMSLVGPRAVIDGEIELFGEHKEEVLSVKPGVTGYWAANGRSDTSYEERVEMETFYANNISIPLDIEILFKTVVSVVKKEGAV
ncbi:sugar transferase [Candidatus Proelusimicrobium excrementi]|uniref:sugar transferase n=1 Tax=Candidatus Proelusimicrobium excrementi TaxID=3416222 RepID=UPI003D10CC38